MKIRIKDNSIRLRLTKTDVSDLKSKQYVAGQCIISPQQIFSYSLKSSAEKEEISADFSNDEMTIILPLKSAEILTETEEITVKGLQVNGDSEPLFILVEKDLKCLDPTHEDQSDMYENPSSAC